MHADATLAERAVLGSLMILGHADDVGDVLKPGDFLDDGHNAIFSAMMALTANGKRLDALLLTKQIKKQGDTEKSGGATYLAELLTETPTAANVAYYAGLVRDAKLLRDMQQVGGEIMTLAQSAHDATEAVARCEELVMAISDKRVEAERIATSTDLMLSAVSRLDARSKGEVIRGVTTGIKSLDLLLGGMRDGEVIILAGRTSMGKSALAVNIACHAALRDSVPTLIVSLEMVQDELADRIWAHESKVPFPAMQSYSLDAGQKQRLTKACSDISAAPLAVDDAPTRNMASIAAIARRQKKRKGLGLLVVDYLQLIQPDNQREPRQEQVAKISRRLKGLARELKIPILVLAQLNRDAEKSGDAPRLSNLRESGAIEQDADAVIFVHRPAYYKQMPTDEEKSVAQLIVAKKRNGRTGTAAAVWIGETMSFRDAATQREVEYGQHFAEFNNRGHDEQDF